MDKELKVKEYYYLVYAIFAKNHSSGFLIGQAINETEFENRIKNIDGHGDYYYSKEKMLFGKNKRRLNKLNKFLQVGFNRYCYYLPAFENQFKSIVSYPITETGKLSPLEPIISNFTNGVDKNILEVLYKFYKNIKRENLVHIYDKKEQRIITRKIENDKESNVLYRNVPITLLKKEYKTSDNMIEINTDLPLVNFKDGDEILINTGYHSTIRDDGEKSGNKIDIYMSFEEIIDIREDKRKIKKVDGSVIELYQREYNIDKDDFIFPPYSGIFILDDITDKYDKFGDIIKI